MSQQINLFNPVFLKQAKYFSAVTMAQSLAVVFVGTLLIFAYSAYQNGVLEKTAQATADEVKQRRDQLLKFGAEYSGSGSSKLLEEELARLEARLKTRQQLLSELKGGGDASDEGFSGHMAALSRQSIQGVWLTGFLLGGTGSDVVLKGRALNAELVPTYLRSLGGSDTLRGRAVTDLKMAAREEAPKAEPATAEAQAAKAAPAAPATPAETPAIQRFVEFVVTMGPAAPAPKPASAKGPS